MSSCVVSCHDCCCCCSSCCSCCSSCSCSSSCCCSSNSCCCCLRLRYVILLILYDIGHSNPYHKKVATPSIFWGGIILKSLTYIYRPCVSKVSSLILPVFLHKWKAWLESWSIQENKEHTTHKKAFTHIYIYIIVVSSLFLLTFNKANEKRKWTRTSYTLGLSKLMFEPRCQTPLFLQSWFSIGCPQVRAL